jgi:dihydrofolate reductase
MPFKIIVAKDEKGGIGLNNKLPWHIKDDLKRFASLTRGNGKNAILMGRNTWDSLPIHPLLGRHTLILSRTSFTYSSVNMVEYDEGRITLFKDMEYVLDYIRDANFEDVWIIGGEKLYNAFLSVPELNKLVKEVYTTEIHGDYGCDTFFGQLDASHYEEISCECVGENHLKFKVYRNKMWGN